MEDEFDKRLARLKASSDARDKYSGKPLSAKQRPLIDRLKYGFKKAAVIGAASLPVLALASYLITRDFLVKNRDYPERNVLFTTINEIEIKGTE